MELSVGNISNRITNDLKDGKNHSVAKDEKVICGSGLLQMNLQIASTQLATLHLYTWKIPEKKKVIYSEQCIKIIGAFNLQIT